MKMFDYFRFNKTPQNEGRHKKHQEDPPPNDFLEQPPPQAEDSRGKNKSKSKSRNATTNTYQDPSSLQNFNSYEFRGTKNDSDKDDETKERPFLPTRKPKIESSKRDHGTKNADGIQGDRKERRKGAVTEKSRDYDKDDDYDEDDDTNEDQSKGQDNANSTDDDDVVFYDAKSFNENDGQMVRFRFYKEDIQKACGYAATNKILSSHGKDATQVIKDANKKLFVLTKQFEGTENFPPTDVIGFSEKQSRLAKFCLPTVDGSERTFQKYVCLNWQVKFLVSELIPNYSEEYCEIWINDKRCSELTKKLSSFVSETDDHPICFKFCPIYLLGSGKITLCGGGISKALKSKYGVAVPLGNISIKNRIIRIIVRASMSIDGVDNPSDTEYGEYTFTEVSNLIDDICKQYDKAYIKEIILTAADSGKRCKWNPNENNPDILATLGSAFFTGLKIKIVPHIYNLKVELSKHIATKNFSINPFASTYDVIERINTELLKNMSEMITGQLGSCKLSNLENCMYFDKFTGLKKWDPEKVNVLKAEFHETPVVPVYIKQDIKHPVGCALLDLKSETVQFKFKPAIDKYANYLVRQFDEPKWVDVLKKEVYCLKAKNFKYKMKINGHTVEEEFRPFDLVYDAKCFQKSSFYKYDARKRPLFAYELFGLDNLSFSEWKGKIENGILSEANIIKDKYVDNTNKIQELTKTIKSSELTNKSILDKMEQVKCGLIEKRERKETENRSIVYTILVTNSEEFPEFPTLLQAMLTDYCVEYDHAKTKYSFEVQTVEDSDKPKSAGIEKAKEINRTKNCIMMLMLWKSNNIGGCVQTVDRLCESEVHKCFYVRECFVLYGNAKENITTQIENARKHDGSPIAMYNAHSRYGFFVNKNESKIDCNAILEIANYIVCYASLYLP